MTRRAAARAAGVPRSAHRSITMLGLDPGLSNTGYAVADVDPERGTIIRTVELGLIKTERDTHARIRRTSDDYRRAHALHKAIRHIVDRHGISVAASEMVTTSPYVRPSLNFGIMLGVLASFDFYLIELLPREVKKAVTGNRDAKKETIIRWALDATRADDVEWPTSARANKMGLTYGGCHVTLAAEHQADALAVVAAAAQSEQLRNSMALEEALNQVAHRR